MLLLNDVPHDDAPCEHQPPATEPELRDEIETRSKILEQFVAAAVGDDPAAAAEARAMIVDRLGPEWLIDASAVIANFEMMTRLADGTGARLRPEQLAAAASIIDDLGLDAFPSARTMTVRRQSPVASGSSATLSQRPPVARRSDERRGERR